MGTSVEVETPKQLEPLTEEYLQAHTVSELRPLSSPIRIVDYDPERPHRFEREAGKIRPVLGDGALQIGHTRTDAGPRVPGQAD
jgi:GrpB-like predicted nucleotidyltransferase (UPF0157 family)